jgi:hypothetical protein
MPGLIRVGHKGAAHVAPGNTIESFEAALEHGVDMIEFDVLRARDGRLLLAHDYEDAARPDALTLEQGLDHFAGEAYAGVELDVDLKLPGYEREVVEGLQARGLAERALTSTMYPESLDRLGDLAPGLRRGWSVPRVRRDYTRSPRPPTRSPGSCASGSPGRRPAASAPGAARRSCPTTCWRAPGLCARSTPPAAVSTSGPSTTCVRSASWRRWASTR